MFWTGVLEQNLEQTLNPKTETDSLFSENLIEAIFYTKGRLIVGKSHQGLHIIHSTTSQRTEAFVIWLFLVRRIKVFIIL